MAYYRSALKDNTLPYTALASLFLLFYEVELVFTFALFVNVLLFYRTCWWNPPK